MPVNKQLLRDTMAFIEDHEALWNQSVWHQHDHQQYKSEENRCGTVMCFAGWAATIDGCRWVGGKNSDADQIYANRADERAFKNMIVLGYMNGRKVIPIRYRAQRVLGLSEYQADTLFDAWNTLDMLREYVDDLINDRMPESAENVDDLLNQNEPDEVDD